MTEQELKQKILEVALDQLEASQADIEIKNKVFISIKEWARPLTLIEVILAVTLLWSTVLMTGFIVRELLSPHQCPPSLRR